MSVHNRLRELGLTLPAAPRPMASYVPTRQVTVGEGRALLFVSGQVSSADGQLLVGRVPDEVPPERSRDAARAAGLSLLAQIDAAAGLDSVEAIAQLTVYVNSTDDFDDHPSVANGASDLLQEVLGDAGRHTRAAVGVSALPKGATVEVSATVVIRTG